MYDKEYAESLYKEYQLNEVNDENDLKRIKNELKDKEILLIGPGNSVHSQKEKIEEYLLEKNPVVISINYIPEDIKTDYVFLSNSKRYVQVATRLCKCSSKIIATSNITATSQNAFDYILNYSTLIDNNAEIIDNSLIMLLKALVLIKIKNVALAGFDGYSSNNTNYFNKSMEYEFVKKMANYLNEYTVHFIRSVSNKITVKFVTDSKYVDGLNNE